MTLTPETTAAAVKDPRKLIEAPLFDRLAAYVAKEHAVTLPYAEGVIGQALVWLRAVAENPGVRLAMSETVDAGWHAFLLHSQDYARFCEENLGYFLHHVPPAPGVSMDEEEIARTLPALHATGYRVEVQHWAGAAYPCCPPNPCVVKVIDQHEQSAKCTGTGAPPPQTGTSEAQRA